MENKESKIVSEAPEKNLSDVKQRIVDVALKLFSEKGFEGTSIRELAGLCNVNIAMISYYFGGKEGLYLECIAKFARGRGEVLQRILTPVQNAEEFKVRLKLFFESMMNLYSTDKHLLRIIMREAQTERSEEFHKKVMTHLHPVFMRVQNYYELAIENGVVKKGTDSQSLAMMTMAVMSHPCMMEKALLAVSGQTIENDEFQNRYINQICDTFFAGVLA